ncbi:hypothetical protein ACFY37_50215, partial [Dactylosporangium aurantiacum]
MMIFVSDPRGRTLCEPAAFRNRWRSGPWDDPRIVGTAAAIQRDLCSNGLLLRYRAAGVGVDGLPGGEGALLACSFWLVDARAWVGRRQKAVERLEYLLELRNDVGPSPRSKIPAGVQPRGMVNSVRVLTGTDTPRRPSLVFNLGVDVVDPVGRGNSPWVIIFLSREEDQYQGLLHDQ